LLPVGRQHVPLLQIWLPVHTWPPAPGQPPQLFTLLAVSMQVPSQKLWVIGHWHDPLTQLAPPLQVFPQELQSWSVPDGTHAPPQQNWPALQQVILPSEPLTQLVLGHDRQTLIHCLLYFPSPPQTDLHAARVSPQASRLHPSDTNRAAARLPPTRRSASRRDTPSASAFASASN